MTMCTVRLVIGVIYWFYWLSTELVGCLVESRVIITASVKTAVFSRYELDRLVKVVAYKAKLQV